MNSEASKKFRPAYMHMYGPGVSGLATYGRRPTAAHSGRLLQRLPLGLQPAQLGAPPVPACGGKCPPSFLTDS
jgi:hypothetical protein